MVSFVIVCLTGGSVADAGWAGCGGGGLVPCAWTATAGANRRTVAAKRSAKVLILLFMMFARKRKEAICTSAEKV